jgi:hypothetical protein
VGSSNEDVGLTERQCRPRLRQQSPALRLYHITLCIVLCKRQRQLLPISLQSPALNSPNEHLVRRHVIHQQARQSVTRPQPLFFTSTRARKDRSDSATQLLLPAATPPTPSIRQVGRKHVGSSTCQHAGAASEWHSTCGALSHTTAPACKKAPDPINQACGPKTHGLTMWKAVTRPQHPLFLTRGSGAKVLFVCSLMLSPLS